MIEPKKNITLNDGSREVRDYIKRHGLSVEQVAENLVSKSHPNGFHANWLNVLINRGLDSNTKKAIRAVVGQLDEQKQKKAQQAKIK